MEDSSDAHLSAGILVIFSCPLLMGSDLNCPPVWDFEAVSPKYQNADVNIIKKI